MEGVCENPLCESKAHARRGKFQLCRVCAQAVDMTGKKPVLTDADRLANAAERVLAMFGAMQDYERQGDRWSKEDHAALDALREAVRGKKAVKA